jgi:predicted transcriptional regulator
MSNKFVDPVVGEVHATRAAMLEAVGGDVAELMQQVADRQQRSHHRIIRQPFRNRTEPADAREAAVASGMMDGLLAPPA